MNTLLQLTGYLKTCPWRVMAAVLLGSGTILAGVGLLATSGYLISASALQPPILDLMIIFVSVRFFGISRAVLRYLERLLSHDITFRLLKQFRVTFFRVLNRLPAAYMQGFRSGSLLSSVTADVDELQNFYVRVFTPAVVALVASSFTIWFLYGFSPPAAWITLVMLVINGVGVPVIMRKLAGGLGQQQVDLRSRLHESWVEQSQGAEEIRLFGLRNKKRNQVAYLSEKIGELEIRQSKITGLQDSLANWMMYVAVFLSLIATVPLIVTGELAGVMLAMILLAIMGSFEATQNMGTAFQYHEATESAAENLFGLEGKTNHGQEEPVTTRNGSGNDIPVTFSGVHFAYDGATVLNNIDFTMEKGTHTAVVGPTGCGKSTLVNLLLRFYEPHGGRILFNGRPIQDVDEAFIRSEISVVDQETYLFNDTLRNNLLMARPDANDQQIMDVLAQAALEDWFNNQPDGLDTVIGEHGRSMSGGERQRLALSRAMLKNSDIWVLDEPTANMDTITEKQLLRTIRKFTRGKTVLWITHRLVDMDHYDQILVISQGQVLQKGKHFTLAQQKGWYQTILALQQNILLADNGTQSK